MAFNTLDYLEKGKVDFIYNLTTCDYKLLIKNVRNSERKNEIIKGFLPLLINKKPYFCFEIIYDNEIFLKEAKYLFKKYYTLDSINKDNLESYLKCGIVSNFLEENFENILKKFIKDLDFIFAYLFENKDTSMHLLKKLAYYPNLHIRYLFMKYMLIHYTDDVSLFYSDITKYLTSETFQENEQLTLFKDYMNVVDVSDLAVIAFENLSIEVWEKFKEFVLSNYDYNCLASKLLNFKKIFLISSLYGLEKDADCVIEFKKDADNLFKTSSDARLYILEKYSSFISRDLLEEYKKYLKIFYINGKLPFVYRSLECCGLSRKLDEYVEKYMDLSINKSYEFLGKGTTATCYKIGDYVIKLINSKWSYEDIICPDLYLILPNLEEILIRDDRNIVCAGIEVQKFLKRSANKVPKNIVYEFKRELARLGYYSTDTLLFGSHGDNCRLLDSYFESGNFDPPNWFKEYPMVLVDRDRIYSASNKTPKQLRNGMS